MLFIVGNFMHLKRVYQRCISAASRRCGNGSDAILETRRRRAL